MSRAREVGDRGHHRSIHLFHEHHYALNDPIGPLDFEVPGGYDWDVVFSGLETQPLAGNTHRQILVQLGYSGGLIETASYFEAYIVHGTDVTDDTVKANTLDGSKRPFGLGANPLDISWSEAHSGILSLKTRLGLAYTSWTAQGNGYRKVAGALDDWGQYVKLTGGNLNAALVDPITRIRVLADNQDASALMREGVIQIYRYPRLS